MFEINFLKENKHIKKDETVFHTILFFYNKTLFLNLIPKHVVILRTKIMTCVFQRYMCTQLQLKPKKNCLLNLSHIFFLPISSKLHRSICNLESTNLAYFWQIKRPLKLTLK